MSTATTANPPPPRRIRKRVLIPSILLGVVAVAFVWAVVRGTWADTDAKDPTTSAEGIVTQLYQDADGRKQVRCAVALDYPLQNVWAVVTDYNRFAEIFPTIKQALGHPIDPTANRHELSGVVNSPIGEWEFRAEIQHEEAAEKCVASWDNPSGKITQNRGSWTLTSAGPDRTLLVYTLEVEVKGYPTFVVRNVLLSRQPTVVEAVADWLKKKPAAP